MKPNQYLSQSYQTQQQNQPKSWKRLPDDQNQQLLQSQGQNPAASSLSYSQQVDSSQSINDLRGYQSQKSWHPSESWELSGKLKKEQEENAKLKQDLEREKLENQHLKAAGQELCEELKYNAQKASETEKSL